MYPLFFIFMVWEKFSSAVFFDTVNWSDILRKEGRDKKCRENPANISPVERSCVAAFVSESAVSAWNRCLQLWNNSAVTGWRQLRRNSVHPGLPGITHWAVSASFKITVGEILLLHKWKTSYESNSGACQNFPKSLSLIKTRNVIWIHLCVICQILGYGMLQPPLLIQHKNAASVGCNLETGIVFLKQLSILEFE